MANLMMIVTSVILIHHINATSGICQQQLQRQQYDHIKDDEGDNIIYARYGHFTKMTCCVPEPDFDAVTWYKLDTETQQWNQVNSSYNTLLLEGNQVLIIESVQLNDGGEYRCDVSNSIAMEKHIERTFNLSIVTCDPLARGPFAISPLPCEKTVAKIGDNVVLPCTGYFGCEDGGDVRLVTWFATEKDTDQWEEVSAVDPRYSVQTFNNHDGILGSNFHISRVVEDDYNRKFMCALFSTQMLHGQTNIRTSLTKPTKDIELFVESASFSFIVAFSALVVIIVVVTLSVTVCMTHRLRATDSKKRQSWMTHGRTDIVKHKTRGVDEVDPCLKPSDLNYV